MHSGAIKNGHRPGFIPPILISLAMHAAFIAAFTIASKNNISENYRPNYVTVEFAEAPAITPEPQPEALPPAEAEKTAPAEAKQPDVVRIPDETQKTKEKEKEKEKVKTKTPDTSAKLMERLKNIEKNIEKKKSEERVAKRIEALEDKAAPKKAQLAASTPTPGAPKEISDDKEAKDYYDKVAAMVRAAWTYPGDTPDDIAVVFKIIVAPSGELVDIITEKRSGNSIFDTSAIKAVKKAAPFPPPPKLKGNKNFEVGFRFCPKGCK